MKPAGRSMATHAPCPSHSPRRRSHTGSRRTAPVVVERAGGVYGERVTPEGASAASGRPYVAVLAGVDDGVARHTVETRVPVAVPPTLMHRPGAGGPTTPVKASPTNASPLESNVPEIAAEGEGGRGRSARIAGDAEDPADGIDRSRQRGLPSGRYPRNEYPWTGASAVRSVPDQLKVHLNREGTDQGVDDLDVPQPRSDRCLRVRRPRGRGGTRPP